MNNFTGTLDYTPNTTATSTVLNAKGNTALSNWAYRLLFLCLAIALSTGVAKAQLMANYAFSSNTNASLEDISVNPDWEDLGNFDSRSSGVQPIGFPMPFMGVFYTHFSFNSNGQLRLHTDAGATAITTGSVSTLSANTVTLAAFGGDNEVQTGLRYKLLGTAPNRKLVAEFTGFYVYWTPNLENAGNVQIWLHEGTGRIDYVYGEVYNASSSSQTRNIFIASSNTTTTAGSVTIAATPTFTTGTTTLTSNTIAAGSGTTTGSPLIEHIGSSAQGSRRIMSFLPTPPAGAPTGLNFTSVQALQLTVNWTDNSTEEIGYVVQYSSDGGNNWTTGTVTAADATTATITGLSASTNYDWRVAAIREVPGTFLSGSQATSAPGNNVSVQSGNWSDPNTWSSAQVPTSSDNVTVGSGHEVVMDINGDAYSLTVTGGGILRSEELPSPTARTVTVLNDVVINASSTIRSAALSPLSVVNNTLSIGGNMTINGDGTFNGGASANGKLNLVFTGATNNSFTSSATATINLNTLTINKGAGPINILEFSPGADFTSPVAGFATLTNGILKLGGTATWSNPVIALSTPTISANGGIWLDNPNATVTAKNASSSISGYFRLSQGTYNIGTLATALIGGATTTNMIIEGGTLNVSGRLYFTTGAGTTFNMSGGTINVQTAGNNTASTSGSFGFSLTTASFTMSGGVINILHPSTGATPYDTYINVSTPNITGGLINIGVPGITPPASVFNGVRQKVPSIHIGDGFTANTAAIGLTVLGNLSVGTGATYNFNTTPSTNFFLVINGNSSAPGNIINNGL
ncbi:MAG TPA: fibronectin type III domain-containing protein, partial [Ferruginibacter sp.]|nr:fibronectin type III domain-containing protein [Ferruginibacter sp.]